jgi:hypothetical protein
MTQERKIAMKKTNRKTMLIGILLGFASIACTVAMAWPWSRGGSIGTPG